MPKIVPLIIFHSDREEPAPTFSFEPDAPADLPDVDYDDDFEADDPMPPR